ncbi:MAG TPA: Nramp family divalent metal transporter [Candidatus Limnocylindrales bacterium]|nr:Nramp family divalent metal transporter [Candidatus Limnocylindrales bacterium]
MFRPSVTRPLRRVQRSLRDRLPNFRVHRTGVIAFLAVLGPGLIAGLAGNDAGGIATYSVLGAETEFSLLWIIPFSTIMLVVVMEMSARMGAVSGQGLGDLIRDAFGVRWTLFAMVVLLIANGSNIIAEFAGAAAALEIFGIPRVVTIVGVAAGIWALVVFASYRVVERVFLSVVVVFAAYVVSAFVAGPDWGEVGRSMVTPTIPFEPGPLLLMVATIGTTVTPYMFFYLQSSVADKGLGPEELGFERADAVLGAIVSGGLALVITVVTAVTIFPTGVTITGAEQAARALEPVAGGLASGLFAFGLFGASVLAATVMPLTTSYAVCESFGWESGVSRKFSEAPAFMGLYTALIVIGAVVVLIPGLPLIGVILVSQNLNGILLPIILVFMLRLVNNSRIMGSYTNPTWLNIVAWGLTGLVILLTGIMFGSTIAGWLA